MLSTENVNKGGVTILRMQGEVDEEGVRTLRIALAQTLQERRYDIVLNLKDVHYVSYMGVGVLVEQLRMFRHFGGDMKLVGLSIHADQLLRTVGALRHFNIFESEDEAVQVYQEAA